MKIIKDVLKVDELKGYEEIEALVEEDLYVNQTDLDIEKVLWADGKIEILNTKILENKILVNGLVKFKVVYRSNEEGVIGIHTLDVNSDFKEEIEIEGIKEDMSARVKANLEYIEYELIDERKVSLKAFINLLGKVERVNLVEIIKDVEEETNLELLKEKIKYNDVINRIDSNASVAEVFELEGNEPEIEEILKIDIHPYEKEYTLSTDRIIISGIVEYSLIYFGGDKLNSIKKDIPFTHFIEVDEINEKLKCQLNMEVISGEYEVKENLEGDLKVIDVEAKINITGKIYDQKEKKVIIDAYSTNQETNLKIEEIRLMENVKDITDRSNIKKEFKEKVFKEIYAIEGNTKIIDSHYMEDKIMIEGLLSLNIYYLDNIKDEITTLKDEIPFKSYVTAEGLDKDVLTNVESSLEELKYNLKENILNINGTIKNLISVNKERKANIINGIEITDEIIDKKDRPSIIIYIVQKGDTLWDISKRYNTTVEEITLSNNITSPETLMPGEKIIIEKQVDMSF